MNRKLIVNQDYFTFSVEQLYDMLCKKVLEKHIVQSKEDRASYEIYSADDAGIIFLRENTDVEWQITKKEMIDVLQYIRKTHEFSLRDLKTMVERKQSPTVAFLMISDIVY